MPRSRVFNEAARNHCAVFMLFIYCSESASGVIWGDFDQSHSRRELFSVFRDLELEVAPPRLCLCNKHAPATEGGLEVLKWRSAKLESKDRLPGISRQDNLKIRRVALTTFPENLAKFLMLLQSTPS